MKLNCYFVLLISLTVSIFFLIEHNAIGQSNPDFTAGQSVPDGATHDWNLGATGARGWIYGNKLETTEARQILITKVERGSPSDGKLQPGDVILGVDDEDFSYDPRTELGKAIVAAEAGKGRLRLKCWRKAGGNSQTSTVVLRLAVLGAYSTTAPFDCRKSKRIFDDGCEALAAKMQAQPKAGNGITRSLNVLALLSSGKEEYLPLIRQQVSWAAKFSDPKGGMLHSWYYGPINILLAEYTMATGDKSFMADLERMTMEIVKGQSAVGSWGHRFARPDGRLNGYGMMNAPGLPLTVSLILARKAGVSGPALDEAIEKSTRLIRFYAGKGSIPYGDHAPWIETHDDNGKNGIAALMFNLVDDSDAAEYFSKMSIASHGGEREMGHTGNFFNMLWAMPGVALSGPQASGKWMQEFGWYYDLARRWDGTYQHQGPPEPRPDSYSGWDSTGAYLLAYAQPLKKLYLTGKQDGVVEQIDQAAAVQLIQDGHDYSNRLRTAAYDQRDVKMLLTGLSSWSPVVRERSANALASRGGDPVAPLTKLLKRSDVYSQLGACQALAKLGSRAAPAIPQLRKTLASKDLWSRIKAAEALAAIGGAARSVVPELLRMLTQQDVEKDPRGMQQRYLCFALFDQRNGLLRGSLEGVDRDALYDAVKAGLRNDDGRARGAISSVYRNLSHEQIEPLLPAIHRAIVEPAPSGVMFADDIRLAGLRILAKHRIQEGMDLCIDVIEFDRWGENRRLTQCLQILQEYGGAARSVLPKLKRYEQQMQAQSHPKPSPQNIELFRQTVELIQSDEKPMELRQIPRS
ncbi:MAG: DUF6288 domain-containing protein [Mariniblastus sp.]|nr:DUF6288 domain-containing protein [Mariniblastus sp.]